MCWVQRTESTLPPKFVFYFTTFNFSIDHLMNYYVHITFLNYVTTGKGLERVWWPLRGWDSGDPCARPAFSSGETSVWKSLKVMLAYQFSIKLWIHCLAIIGMPLARRQASRLTLLTPLKAPFSSNAIRVTTLDCSHTLSIAFASTSNTCSVLHPGLPPDCMFRSSLYVSAQNDGLLTIIEG